MKKINSAKKLQIHRKVRTILHLYRVARIRQHHIPATVASKHRIIASPSPGAAASGADLSHIDSSKNDSPSCTSDTSHDHQVDALLSKNKYNLTSLIPSMITQALLLRSFVADQLSALSNMVCILETEIKQNRQSKVQ